MIEPALSAEEWAAGAVFDDWYVDGDGFHVTVTTLNPFADDYDARVQLRSLDGSMHLSRVHAIAALCLYGQPFGFTREDVEDLRGLREVLAKYGVLGTKKLTHLADRLEALLPPEDA